MGQIMGKATRPGDDGKEQGEGGTARKQAPEEGVCGPPLPPNCDVSMGRSRPAVGVPKG